MNTAQMLQKFAEAPHVTSYLLTYVAISVIAGIALVAAGYYLVRL